MNFKMSSLQTEAYGIRKLLEPSFVSVISTANTKVLSLSVSFHFMAFHSKLPKKWTTVIKVNNNIFYNGGFYLPARKRKPVLLIMKLNYFYY